MYIGLIEWDAEVLDFGQPDCTAKVLNQCLFAGADDRATVGLLIRHNELPPCYFHTREAEASFERYATNLVIVLSVVYEGSEVLHHVNPC